MIYDISQPVFECAVFPGDPQPEKRVMLRIETGDICNLTAFSMCAHNGTHVDAPYHFINDGKTIDQVALDKWIGAAYVYSHTGPLTAQDAARCLKDAENAYPGAQKKLLIRGRAVVTLEAAKVFAAAGVDLVGNESQTVGP